MSELLPSAVLWDLDGTLIDSEPYWLSCETDLITRHGGTWSEQDGLQLVGNDLLTSGRILREKGGVDLSPEQIVEDLLTCVVGRLREYVPWRPGALELLTALADIGVPNAIVTMSYRPMVEVILAALPTGVVRTEITGDMVARGKPHPDPYLDAAAALGLKPHECVAIEDSPTGIRSARAAGVPVIGVEHLVPLREHTDGPVLESLRGVRPIDLLPLVKGSSVSGVSVRPR